MIEDGSRITYIAEGPHTFTIQIIRAFAIGDRAVFANDHRNPYDGEIEAEPRDVVTGGWVKDEDEGVRWCRGWTGEAARALRAQLALRAADRHRVLDDGESETPR